MVIHASIDEVLQSTSNCYEFTLARATLTSYTQRKQRPSSKTIYIRFAFPQKIISKKTSLLSNMNKTPFQPPWLTHTLKTPRIHI